MIDTRLAISFLQRELALLFSGPHGRVPVVLIVVYSDKQSNKNPTCVQNEKKEYFSVQHVHSENTKQIY